MSTLTELFCDHTGDWVGTNGLRMLPSEAFQQTTTSWSIRVVAGHSLLLNYHWGDNDGILFIGPNEDGLTATWTDSFHQQPQWMNLTGGIVDSGLNLSAHYSEGFQWQMFIAATDPGRLAVTMRNVAPGERPYDAVDVTLSRP